VIVHELLCAQRGDMDVQTIVELALPSISQNEATRRCLDGHWVLMQRFAMRPERAFHPGDNPSENRRALSRVWLCCGMYGMDRSEPCEAAPKAQTCIATSLVLPAQRNIVVWGMKERARFASLLVMIYLCAHCICVGTHLMASTVLSRPPHRAVCICSEVG